MAATVPVEREGQTSPLLEQALAIGEAPDETGQVKTKEAQPGSFEAFMGSFGNPNRWAGGR